MLCIVNSATYAMCTYCCCTVYSLLFTFVQFVLYQQFLLGYSRMFLVMCTVSSCSVYTCTGWEEAASEFLRNHLFRWQTVVMGALRQYLWCTHNTWNSYAAVQVHLIPASIHLYMDKPVSWCQLDLSRGLESRIQFFKKW